MGAATQKVGGDADYRSMTVVPVVLVEACECVVCVDGILGRVGAVAAMCGCVGRWCIGQSGVEGSC